MTARLAAGVVAIALAGPALADQPAAQPFVTVPGSFAIATAGQTTTLILRDGAGRETARFDVNDCPVCVDAGGACARHGVFEMHFPGSAAPMIGASCPGAGGQLRFLAFDPDRDQHAPVLDALGERYAILPDRIEVSGAGGAIQVWRPDHVADADEVSWVLANIEAAAGRRMGPPGPIADPKLQKLAARLSKISEGHDVEALVGMAAPDVLTSFGGDGTIDELRRLIAEPWFWDEFARVLAGGGVIAPDPEGPGRMAVFPAAFSEWPDDLDAFSYVYGDRAGAVLRAGPSDRAPQLMPVQGLILARGPILERENALRDAGWNYVCADSAGCGYARDSDVRSPIDFRAIFTESGTKSAWQLVSFVAGD